MWRSLKHYFHLKSFLMFVLKTKFLTTATSQVHVIWLVDDMFAWSILPHVPTFWLSCESTFYYAFVWIILSHFSLIFLKIHNYFIQAAVKLKRRLLVSRHVIQKRRHNFNQLNLWNLNVMLSGGGHVFYDLYLKFHLFLLLQN